ncbi:hypothetical protein QUA74_29270, partial [Microcoleus sp. LAD1_D3]|uniref:hypothetical protein n=1 Tax=Microcoleus sp. LAD1_D3 TaxID=2819365 RepID=UPI002FD281A2
MILVGSRVRRPACCENTQDGRDTHPTKQSKSSRNYATPKVGVAEYRYEFKISQLLEARLRVSFVTSSEKLIHTLIQQR